GEHDLIGVLLQNLQQRRTPPRLWTVGEFVAGNGPVFEIKNFGSCWNLRMRWRLPRRGLGSTLRPRVFGRGWRDLSRRGCSRQHSGGRRVWQRLSNSNFLCGCGWQCAEPECKCRQPDSKRTPFHYGPLTAIAARGSAVEAGPEQPHWLSIIIGDNFDKLLPKVSGET